MILENRSCAGAHGDAPFELSDGSPDDNSWYTAQYLGIDFDIHSIILFSTACSAVL